MASIDFDAVGTALAARFAPGVVTPPAGLGNIRASLIDAPNRLGPLPIVIVLPGPGRLAPGNGSRLVSSEWLVRFHFARTRNLTRETSAMRRWLGILIDQIRVGESLGIGAPVAVARVASYRPGILPWGNVDYTGVELVVTIEFSHGWAA